jgi:hypothetical protein
MKTSRPRSFRALLRSAGRRRGFTLLELVIALTTGIAVAGAAYLLSKNSMTVFEAEARMSQAQFGATMGMNRLVSDVQRAGFMSNPNFAKEPGKACGSTAGFNNVKALQVLPDQSAGTTPVSVANGLSPDRIRIMGNLSTTELFVFRTIQSRDVYMAMNEGAMQRTLTATKNGGAPLRELFLPGRYVRLIDKNGKETYAQIASISCNGGGSPCDQWNVTDFKITLDRNLPSDITCGAWVGGGLINPISIVDYWVGKPTVAGFGITQATADLISADPAIAAQTGDNNRTELVRTELLDQGGPLVVMPVAFPGAPPPSEVISEYTVDFAVGVTARTGVGNSPNVVRYDADVDGATIAGLNAADPQRFTGVRIRLSTRTRAPDREGAIQTNPRARFDVFGPHPVLGGNHNGSGTPTHFARVRTLIQDVSLPNLTGITW